MEGEVLKGLPICYRTVKAMNNLTFCESECSDEGKGTKEKEV